MANMIPPFFGHGAEAERYVYRALQQNLSPTWTVWWALSYPGAGTAEGRDGEIDFLCFHPAHGLVVLEVKGGTLDFHDGQWFQNGRRLACPPPLQAARNRHTLTTYLCRALKLAPLPFPVVHAVWAPFAAEPALTPLPAAGLMLGAAALQAPEAALLRLLTHDPHACAGSFPVERLRAVLSPAVQYRPSWRQRRTLETARLTQLTREQARTFDAFAQFRRLRVRGCAGSGKTLLALRRAAQLANEGKRVLLPCFTLLLSDHLRALPTNLPGVQAEAVNPFLCRLLNREEDENDPEFWHTLARDALPAAQALAQTMPYDTVIVDEGQDFSPALWAVVKALAPEPCGFLVFYDPAQNIFHRDLSALPVFPWPEACLETNCRNTRGVFEALRPYAPDGMKRFPDVPPGSAPETYFSDTRAGLRARLQALLHDLTAQGIPLEDILVLGAHARPKMALEETFAAFPALRYFTYRKFKGLETPILILLDVDDTNPLWDRAARYTAISRAIHKVILLQLTPTSTSVPPGFERLFIPHT